MIYALAACLLLLLLGGWWWLAGDDRAVLGDIANVELSSGDLTVGETLKKGDILEPAGRVAVRMVRGQSVRLDEGSRLLMLSESRLELERGAVYIDSGPSAPAGAATEILTPLGSVTETGTQFEVRLVDESDSVRISVREGGVSITTDEGSHAAVGGEQLTLGRDGSAERSALAPDAQQWFWVLETAPAIEIEGRSLASYLDWVARETGWRIRYADETLQRSAETILLHGTIEGLRPDESLGVVLEGSGLFYLREDGSVLIARP
jgi:ferric-dicitrate binding protein FerR (iron transport regulator)